MKVFCKDCKHHALYTHYGRREYCYAIGNKIDTHYAPLYKLVKEPSDKNKYNDCTSFQLKKSWWKFWPKEN